MSLVGRGFIPRQKEATYRCRPTKEGKYEDNAWFLDTPLLEKANPPIYYISLSYGVGKL